jgi:hypothetical protein
VAVEAVQAGSSGSLTLPDAGGRISKGVSIRSIASFGGVLAAEHYPEAAVRLA